MPGRSRRKKRNLKRSRTFSEFFRLYVQKEVLVFTGERGIYMKNVREGAERNIREITSHKRKMASLLTGICVAALLAGCGSANDEVYYGGSYLQNTKSYDMAMEAEESYITSDAGSWGMENSGSYAYETEAKSMNSTQTAQADSARKIIRRVSMDVETKEFDSLLAGLNAKVAALGGYVEQSNIYNGSNYSGYRSARSASMTVRIPQKSLDEFVNEVSVIGNVTRKTEGVDDITLSYVDTESRQKALKTEQERLLELLSKAESLDDVLTIESRLSEVRYQIESYTSTLRTYDNLVDYSTVTLSINEVKELTPVEEETAWQRMKNGFAESVESVADGFKEFVIWFVIHIPQLILWAAVIAIIVLIRRAYKKKHPGKNKGKTKYGRKWGKDTESIDNAGTSGEVTSSKEQPSEDRTLLS